MCFQDMTGWLSTMLWQPLVKMTNKPLSKLKKEVSCEDYKRT